MEPEVPIADAIGQFFAGVVMRYSRGLPVSRFEGWTKGLSSHS